MKALFAKYKWKTIIAFVIFVIIIPFAINWLFKIDAICDFFVAEWGPGDALAFYGTILASAVTIIGVYITVEQAQHNYHMDEINRVKPYLALTHYKTHVKANIFSGLGYQDTSSETQGNLVEYEEYKLKNIYIIIEENGVKFTNKLSDSQQHRLQSGGFEWYDHGSGCRSLQAHPFVSIPFEAENVGNGAANNTLIAFYKKGDERRGVSVYTLKQGDTFYFHVFCDDSNIVADSEYIIEVCYQDILGNSYSQKYPVFFGSDTESNRFCTNIDLTGNQEKDEKNMEA